MVKLLSEAKREEAKEKFILAAFIGWQMGAGGKKTFGEYVRHLGLSDRIPQQVEGKDRVPSQKEEDEALSRMGIRKKGKKQ